MKVLDLLNKRFGKLVVLQKLGSNNKQQIEWECICDCGNKKIATSSWLNQKPRHCGCEYIKKRGHPYKSHGLSKKIPEYAAWENMKRRCYYPKHNRYQHYGGRGIKVCDRWVNSFENFYKDMGCRPSKNHSLERICLDKDYSLDNCIWATSFEQSRNTKRNVKITINGETKCLKDWAKYYKIGVSTVNRRRKMGYELNESIFIKNKVYEKETSKET